MIEKKHFFVANSEEEFEKELRKPVIELVPFMSSRNLFKTDKIYFNKPLVIDYTYPYIFTRYNYADEQYVYERNYIIIKRFYKLLSYLKNNNPEENKELYNQAIKYFDLIAKVEELNYEFQEKFLTYQETFFKMVNHIAKKYVLIKEDSQKVKRNLSFWEKLNPSYWLMGKIPTDIIEGYFVYGVEEEWINDDVIKRDVKDLFQLFKEMESLSPKIVEEYNNLKIENKKFEMNLNEKLKNNKHIQIIQDSIYLGDQNIRILKKPESLLLNNEETIKCFKNMINKIK